MRYISATFRSTVDQWLKRVLVFHIHHIHESRIYPSSCFDAVKTANDELKLHVEIFVEFLYPAIVRCDLNAFDPALDELGGDFCLELPYIGLPE